MSSAFEMTWGTLAVKHCLVVIPALFQDGVYEVFELLNELEIGLQK